MTSKPQAIRDDKRLRVALTIMEWGHFRHVPVVDGQGLLVGVLSQTDLLAASASVLDPSVPRAERELRLAAVPVTQVMRRGVVTIGAEDSIQHAAALMRRHKVSCLPVVDGRRLVGILTAFDLLGALIGMPE